MAEGPELCVGAVVINSRCLLMVRRGRPPGLGLWSLPGGRVARGETLAEAVVRELAEETGLEAVCGDVVGWVERLGTDHHFVIVDFWAQVLERRRPRAGDDAEAAAWVPVAGVGDLPLVEGLAEFLHDHGILEVIT
ncbi:MAG: NUDIX hydrolase [Acidimicrobiales bacterium]